jgi:hypothetical protein
MKRRDFVRNTAALAGTGALCGGRGGGATLTGTFTARLNAGGTSYTQAFSVLPESR